MQSYLLMGLNSIDTSSSSILHTSKPYLDLQFNGVCYFGLTRSRTTSRRLCSPVAAYRHQNHYDVLGVSPDASPSDIKKAYRLLALKFHPDVSKDSRADDVFKSIRLAYDTLSDETTRNQYDRAARFHVDPPVPQADTWDYNLEFEGSTRVYRWQDLRRQMRRERYRQKKQKYDKTETDSEEEENKETEFEEEQGSFIKVLRSAFLSIFLMQTIGARLSLTFSSLMALLDDNLDPGYKTGYLVAWLMGGKGGVLFTLCLSFASWVCGKTSSGNVAIVVIAMWVGSNLSRVVPFPQGALLTLLYMSIKLQSDLT